MEELKGIKTLILNETDGEELRRKIRHYFHHTFTIDERLYELLADDDAFYLRPDPLRHPLVFYLGHTSVFYINKLNIARVTERRINPAYESMFAVGVDEMSWDDLNEANYDWPPIPMVRQYRDEVREFIDSLILSLPAPVNGIDWNSPWWAIIMGIEHQRIHLETSSVLIRQLPLERLQPMDFWDTCPHAGSAPLNELKPVSGGQIDLGKSFDDPLYGWDNEYGHKSFEVENFKAAKYLVSNGEFLEFIKAKGYLTQKYWSEEGWAWRNFANANHPRFWSIDAEGKYWLRTIASLIPLPWNHPAEVNYLEAKAFCNWKADLTGLPIRMPTEAEWYILRDTYLNTDQPYWDKAPANINLEYWASTCPVDTFAHGEFFDLIGNVWQWSETPISAFPGFKVHPYYDDFSVPTFDTRHNLIKTGSFISTGNEAIRDSRYAFRRHFFQHAGFRYVSSPTPVIIEDDLYEDDPEILPWCISDWETGFATDLIDTVREHFGRTKGNRALHFGCKTGRLTMELAAYFSHVTGVDSSARIIRLASKMKAEGSIRYKKYEEGEIFEVCEANLMDFGLTHLGSQVEFWQADSSNLIQKFNDYDMVFAVNTLGSAIKPSRFLADIPKRLNPAGILIIADAYDWVSKPPFGGFRKDGEPYRSLDALHDALDKEFMLLSAPKDISQCLPQSQRMCIHQLLQVTVWQKRN